MSFRPATEKHLPFLMFLDRQAFPLLGSDTEGQWREHLQWTTLLFSKIGEPVGFSVVLGTHLYSIAVIDEHRGKGFGSLLLAHAIGKGATSLFVRESNEGARRLYESFGFVLNRSDRSLISEGLLSMVLPNFTT